MKIKLFKDAASAYVRRCYKGASPRCGMLHRPEWAEMLRKVEGQWLEVETDWLFTNQFNTAPIPGVSELGMRIMAEDVEEIADDVRIGRIHDGYTHKHYANLASVPAECLTEERKAWLIQWEENSNKHARGVILYERRVFPEAKFPQR